MKIKDTPIILTEYYYAFVKNGSEPRPFSYVEIFFPELEYSEELVPIAISPTDAVYFRDPERLKEARFIYTELWTDEKQEILFSTISHSKYKIWLNGLYVGASTGFDLFTFYLTLEKGENKLVFEVDLANPNYYDMNNRVILQAAEEKNPQSFLCGTCLEYHKWIQFFQTPDCRKTDCTCVFIPRCFRIISSASVKVLDDFENLLAQSAAFPGVPLMFQAEMLRKKSPKTVRIHLLLEVFFTDGTSTIRRQIVLLQNYDAEKEALRLRYRNALNVADSYTKDFLSHEFDRFFSGETKTTHGEAVALFRLEKYLRRIEQQEEPYYRAENNTMIYYRSPLDLQYRKIRICKPPQLSTDRPGLIVFINMEGNAAGVKIAHLLKEHPDLILIDIGIAGFSTGTPISEALIAEALDEVRKLYSFNERRIYWYGYCNNGSAVWSFCQNHPHWAAKTVTVESLPDLSRIRNLDYCKSLIYYLKSKDQKDINSLISKKNNRTIPIQSSTHNYMQFYQYRAENFSDLNSVLPDYPENLQFSTVRMRFNRSFWITLHEIRREKMRASVSASIVNTKTICVKLINCDDFSLEVPPQMDAVFKVIINGVSLVCEKQPVIRFVREKKKFCISSEPANENSKKGTGLLDVYYGPLRIVHDGSELASDIAQKFAAPETMSFSPKLQVKFPVYSALDCTLEAWDRNLILINVDAVNGKSLNLPIQTSEDGYYQEGVFVKGYYCVLQRISHPWNPLNSILHIGSNNLAQFKKHLFLRKIVLPSMLTGISSYWNAQAVILSRENMREIYEL